METSASQIVIAGLMATAFLVGSFSILAAFVPSNDPNMLYYNKTFAKFNEMNQNTETFKNTIKDTQPSSGVLGIANGLLQASYGALKQMWDSITIMSDIVDQLSRSSLGIPGWVTAMITSLIFVSVAFSLVAAYFHWRI